MLLPLLLLLQTPVPTLDGTISPGEWDRATHVTGSNRLEVWHYTDPTDSALYLAVRGRGNGFPHVAISRGDTVLILHASAALGTAKYAGPGETKRRVQEFSFRARGVALTGTAQDERDRFYREEGWVATTMGMGRDGETEFKISPRLLGSGRIAVAYWAEGSGVSRWPAALSDAVGEERMVQGWLPEDARFTVMEWEPARAR